MLEAIKPLLDSGIINEETSTAINEAWEAKLSEAKETVRAELREEFSQRYEHDKSVMVEALDKMVNESLSKELQEFAEDKKRLAEDRVKYNTKMSETADKFKGFLVGKLTDELKELREDRKVMAGTMGKVEQFVIRQLAEEIKEFEQDKKDVVETKVKLVAGAKEKLDELKTKFVARSSALVKEAVATNLESELTQLKEDIQTARENMFGRRLFEAFASEFAGTHLNENKEIKKLQSIIAEKDVQLAEATQASEDAKKLVESKESEIKVIKESSERKETLNGLLKTLNKEKAAVMGDLLESVQTEKLQSAFDKYLPAVLNNSKIEQAAKQVLSENKKEVTGDKTAKDAVKEDGTNIIQLKRLAGL